MTSTSISAEPSLRTGPVVIADVPLPEPLALPADAGAPRRIASLATGVAETLVALGAADRIVGRDETSTAPQIADVPVVTRAHSVSAERVLATEPDVVLVDSSTSPPEALEQIRAAGVDVVEVPEAWSTRDVQARTAAVASAAGMPATEASEAAATWVTSAGPSSMTSIPRVAFLYLRGTSAVYLLGGEGSGADDLIESAGGVDVGAEAGLGPFTPLTAEALASANPDVLLVMDKGLESVGGLSGLQSLPGVAQTRAAREGRIVSVPDTLLLSFGPRTGALISALQESFADLGP
jgi:iron complex transport system substrate-binding protein